MDRIIGEANKYLQKYNVKIDIIINLIFDEDWTYLDYKNNLYDFINC